ncbi:NAD-dependent epimerase/dehydratase family protein [archaeon]|nr:NAD-dependent epimerase/dehydratase family protein [archaeon]MBT4351320.1 NAD-dependent epimerase/dehydratase family protein [archaeon]MBT4647017.1 NAD-dependent epimerase/dehydratase family protein [archaeon]MBT6822461.1 NAD-dependent epimerase/dehydratase family protein [archaeon]MBT7391990.1 NAD-dependent epimerase/dehydratase family protein [archaeon]
MNEKYKTRNKNLNESSLFDKMTNYAITGGLGFLGQFIVNEILKNDKNSKIKIISRSNIKKLYHNVLNDSRVSFISSNLLTEKKFKYLNNVDYVIHNAALVSFKSKDKNKMYKVNVNGTINLIEACKKYKIKRFVYVSSISAINITGEKGLLSDERNFQDENNPFINHYTKSKTIAEKKLHQIADSLNYVIGCPSVILGPGDERVIKVLKIFNLLPIILVTNPIQSTIDVRDCAEAFYFLLKHGKNKERYIISNQRISMSKLVSLFFKSLKRKKIILKIPKILIDLLKPFVFIIEKIFVNSKINIAALESATANKEFSNKKIKDLGFEFKYPLTKTIEDIINWYKNERSK